MIQSLIAIVCFFLCAYFAGDGRFNAACAWGVGGALLATFDVLGYFP